MMIIKKDILILGKSPTLGLDFCLSLNYNGSNSYLFVNGANIYHFKAKDSELIGYQVR